MESGQINQLVRLSSLFSQATSPSRVIFLNSNVLLVKVKNITELQKCILIANNNKVQCRVQSAGKNWGYSVHDEAYVLFDLSLMNKIVQYDEKLAYITLQAGVTFQQVYEFLKKRGSHFMLSITGGPPEGSVAATTLERGIGKGLYGDLYHYCCGLEAILPSGKIIHTGYGHFPNAKSATIHKTGLGPIFDGLFTQSNLGIVTQMTIWLTPRPHLYRLLTFTLKNDRQLIKVTDVIRYLKLHGIFSGNFLLANQFRILTEYFQYPWEKAKYKTPLPNPLLNRMSNQAGLYGKWIGQMFFSSFSKNSIKEQQRVITKHLNPVVTHIESASSDDIDKVKQQTRSFYTYLPSDVLERIFDNIYNLERSVFLGVPTERYLRSLYWRKRIPIPKKIDPIRDECGVIWFNCVIPTRGNYVYEVFKVAKRILLEYSFEPNFGFNFVSERALYLIGVILYDKTLKEEHQKALNCYQTITHVLAKKGYLPYRISPNGKKYLPNSPDDYDKFYTRIKNLLDPNNILN